MSDRYCRDCLHAQVTGRDALGDPLCQCALGHWGPASWQCGLVAPACGDFVLAAERPGNLKFWQLYDAGYALAPTASGPLRPGKEQN